LSLLYMVAVAVAVAAAVEKFVVDVIAVVVDWRRCLSRRIVTVAVCHSSFTILVRV